MRKILYGGRNDSPPVQRFHNRNKTNMAMLEQKNMDIPILAIAQFFLGSSVAKSPGTNECDSWDPNKLYRTKYMETTKSHEALFSNENVTADLPVYNFCPVHLSCARDRK